MRRQDCGRSSVTSSDTGVSIDDQKIRSSSIEIGILSIIGNPFCWDVADLPTFPGGDGSGAVVEYPRPPEGMSQ